MSSSGRGGAGAPAPGGEMGEICHHSILHCHGHHGHMADLVCAGASKAFAAACFCSELHSQLFLQTQACPCAPSQH